MKKEKIESKQLQRLIALKTEKLDYSEVTDEDFDKITDISIDSRLLNGGASGISLDVISLFPNVTDVIISNYELTQEDLNRLLELKQLRSIEIARCVFSDVDFSDFTDKRLSFTGCEALNFKYPSVKTIIIRGSRVNFECIDFKSATDIIIQESNIYNAHSLKDYPNIRSVNLDGSTLFSNYESKIPDIEVADETRYSHSIELDLNDPNK